MSSIRQCDVRCVSDFPSAYQFQRSRCIKNTEMLWIHKNRFSFEFMQCNIFNFLIQKYLNFLACTLVVPCLYQYHLTFHHHLNVYSSFYQVIESVGQFGASLAQLHHFDGSSNFIQVFLCIFCYITTFQKLYQVFYLAIDFKVYFKGFQCDCTFEGVC